MVVKKNLSNPFSTGGGGVHFEAHVQASFVALMLSGGHAPCLPCWPIKEIKLQGKVDGFETDDLIVIVENSNKEQRKLLGQVKHAISITEKSPVFREVIQAAWNDFNNLEVFTKGKDIIALITGPISASDTYNVQWLLNQARCTNNVDEFFRNVQQANFSPSKSSEKLDVLMRHLKEANDGNDISKDEIYSFLRHFYLLGYDLGNDFGVILSLLHSHISQFQQQNPQFVWARIVDFVQTCNQGGGTITPRNLPEDLLEVFKREATREMPKKFKITQESHKTDWTQHPDATYIALAILMGGWSENNQSDCESITKMLGISYEEWINKAREILHYPDSPLTLTNGIWKVVNRIEMWNILGPRIIDKDIEAFKSLSISILKEPDPAFELPKDERYAASIHNKVLKYSQVLRNGIADGLAILANYPDACTNCSNQKSETAGILVLHDVLSDADWILWASLNSLLPSLSESAPEEFLHMVEQALTLKPCPFDEIFIQESNGIMGENYLTGLLWALEGLAWDEQFFIRTCVALGELASRDPGGQWANRPSNSLITILLPWLPQTLASVEKRKVAVKTLFVECPRIAWNLIIQLLSSKSSVSAGSHKPIWRMVIPDDWGKDLKQEEYWQQISFYGELAVTQAGLDTELLSVLIDHFDELPKSSFDKLISVLSLPAIYLLPDERRRVLWSHLIKFTNKHRRFPDSEWALSNELLISIEKILKQLAPKDPFILYQHLFVERDFDLYEKSGNWESQQKKLEAHRETAMLEIYELYSVDGVIQFADTVESSHKVGTTLGVIADDRIEQYLLPNLLDTTNNKRKTMLSSFVWRRCLIRGWDWCDGIDKSGWTSEQIGQFLAFLPFTEKAWDRVSLWLREEEGEYWNRTDARAFAFEENLSFAVEKLIEYGRPYAAINSLGMMIHEKLPIDVKQSVRALIASFSSSEPNHVIDSYHIIELIKVLQEEPSVNKDDLLKVEWAYLSLLDHHSGIGPKILESRLASDPEFFCQIIQWIYRSKKVSQPSKEPTEESKEIAKKAWRLLHKWETPPGFNDDRTFNEELFLRWLLRVKEICIQSGHLEVAQIHIGQVLTHAPGDSSGLWINRTIASVLNDRESDDIRKGYRTGMYNSRGMHYVDPTGRQEKELASRYRDKAEEVENVGFQRFAATLRSLADSYNRDAKYNIFED